MDLASLGLAIDSGPAVKAAADLDKLAQSARGVGQSVDAISAGVAKANAGLQQTAQTATQAAAGHNAHTRALNDNAGAAKLNSMQLQELAAAARHSFDALASGASPLRVLATEGSKVSAVFTSGSGGVAGTLSALGTVATGAASAIGLAGAAIGVTGAAVIAGAAAYASYSSEQREVERSLLGIGRASGASAAQINAIAISTAGSGNISVRSARDMASQYAATGRIGAAMYGDLIRVGRDFAIQTGQELPDATKALAEAFADPAKGADALNKQLGFLDASTRENIQRLDAQGDRLGAQRALFDAMSSSIAKASDHTSGWGQITQTVGNAVSNVWDRTGRNIDKALTGGNIDQQLSTAQKRLAQLQALGPSGPMSEQDQIDNFGGSRDDEAQRLRTTVASLEAQIAQRTATGTQTGLNQRSQVVDDLVKSLNPTAEKLKQLEIQAQLIRKELASGVVDPDGRSRATMDALVSSAKELREDMAAGGTRFADAIRDAQFKRDTVGYSPQAQRVAGIDKQAEDDSQKVRASWLDAPLQAKQLASIEERRQIELDAARRQTYNDTSTGSGRYSIGVGQAPEQYRDLIYNSATSNGVNPDLIAAQIRRESRFNPNAVSSAGAQGISQFMPPTAAGMGLSNPFDASQAIPKQAELMAQLLRQFNGNEVAALVGYNAGPRTAQRFVAGGQDVATLPRETQAYIKDILTPPPNAQQAVTASVERNRALTNESTIVALNSQLLGVNGEKLDAATRFQQALNQAIAQGVEITPQYRAELMKNAEGMAAAARSLAGTRAGADLDFNRDQLGRSAMDQRVYSSARGIYGDTSTPAAQAYISKANDNAQLTEARSTLTSAAQGFANDLLHGKSAAQAFGGALQQISSKLLNSVIDSAIGSLFKAGGGGFLSSIFGHADGGMISGPGGPREDRVLARLSPGEFVVNARATSQNLGLLHAINGGVPAFADGGQVMASMPNLATLPIMPPAANMNGTQGTPQPVTISIDARGAQGNSEVQAAINRGVSQGLTAYDQNLSQTLHTRVDTARANFGSAA